MSFAQNIVILDEGHNTQSTYNTNAESNFGRQLCFSKSDVVGSFTGEVTRASYCANGQSMDVTSVGAAQVPQSRNIAGLNFTLGRDRFHGNVVSAAAHSFSPDVTVRHIHTQIFHAFTPETDYKHQTDVDTILDALQYLNTNAESLEIDVINMSFATQAKLNNDGSPRIPTACIEDAGEHL